MCSNEGSKQRRKRYVIVIVDDYTKFTRTIFLKSKDETLDVFSIFVNLFQKKLSFEVLSFRPDHDSEFENSNFLEVCAKHEIDHNFSAPRTPQQKRMVEKKNRALEDMARTMLIFTDLPTSF